MSSLRFPERRLANGRCGDRLRTRSPIPQAACGVRPGRARAHCEGCSEMMANRSDRRLPKLLLAQARDEADYVMRRLDARIPSGPGPDSTRRIYAGDRLLRSSAGHPSAEAESIYANCRVVKPGGPHPTTAAGATPLHFVRNLQCGPALAAKSSNRSRLPRDLLPKDFTRKVSRCLFVIQALATHVSIAQP
jgi:hypothetical protein